ncbi:hypothetical protein GGF32_008513 [Allomyces javanicus]|nr:hypothetical protein GGF32_008513 [Allomyces javanicus]
MTAVSHRRATVGHLDNATPLLAPPMPMPRMYAPPAPVLLPPTPPSSMVGTTSPPRHHHHHVVAPPISAPCANGSDDDDASTGSASPPFQLGGNACRVTHTDASGRCAAQSVEFVLPAPGHKACVPWSPLATRVAAAAYGAVVAEADRAAARCVEYGAPRDRDYPRASAAWCEEEGRYDATRAAAPVEYAASGPARPNARPWDAAPSPTVSAGARATAAAHELAPQSYAPPSARSSPDTVQLPPLRHVLAGMGMARTA